MNGRRVLLILLAALISLMSGVTYSFFTDSSFAGEAVFLTGSNEVEIVENKVPNSTDGIMAESLETPAVTDYGNWMPGVENAKFISWSFRNAGDQDSWYMVEIGATWTNGATNEVHWVQAGDVMWDEEWIDLESGNLEYTYPEIVRPGEEVELSFMVWCESIIDVEDTDYTVDLEVESYQVH